MLEAEPRETSGSVVPVKLIVRFAFLIRSSVHTFLRFVLVAVRNSSRCYAHRSTTNVTSIFLCRLCNLRYSAWNSTALVQRDILFFDFSDEATFQRRPTIASWPF